MISAGFRTSQIREFRTPRLQLQVVMTPARATVYVPTWAQPPVSSPAVCLRCWCAFCYVLAAREATGSASARAGRSPLSNLRFYPISGPLAAETALFTSDFGTAAVDSGLGFGVSSPPCRPNLACRPSTSNASAGSSVARGTGCLLPPAPKMRAGEHARGAGHHLGLRGMDRGRS